jgi:hypothetical protein
LYVDGQESVQPTTAYGPPEIHRIYPIVDRGTGAKSDGNSTVDVTTGGGDVIHIVGQNFGSSIEYLESITYGCVGSSSAWSFDITKDCTLTKAHTEFVCITAPGVGKDLIFTIFVAGQASVVDSGGTLLKKTATLSYQSPNIAYIERNTRVRGS